MFSRRTSFENEGPSLTDLSVQDPRSPRGSRRVTYTFTPTARPSASNIERLEPASVASTAQIDALYEACRQLIISVRDGQDEYIISENRENLVRAREGVKSRTPDGMESVSWVDHSDYSRDNGSIRTLPLSSTNISESANGSVGDPDFISVFSADDSVWYQHELVEGSEGDRDSIRLEDSEMMSQIPVPLNDQQVMWMMHLDANDDNMIIYGFHGYRVHFRRHGT